MLQNKRNRFLTISIAVILIFTMLLSACDSVPVTPGSSAGSVPSSAPSIPTVPSTPSSPTIPSTPPIADQTKIVLNPAQLVYEMTDADVSKFYTLLNQMKNAALDSQDGDAVMALSDQVDDHYYYMSAQRSIASVLHYNDLNDKDASDLYLECTDTLTDAYDTYMKTVKELYDTDFPAKERFFGEWSEQDIAMLLSYSPEITALQERNAQIEVAYQDLQNDPDMYTKMVPLYIELVQNNNRIAQAYGYDNYYAYAYDLVHNRDYGSEEIKTMRSLVSEYLPEAAANAYNKFYQAYSALNPTAQMRLEAFLYEPYKPSYTDEIEDYFKTLPQQTRLHMLDMFDGNIIIAEKASAQEGAFTTSIGKDNYLCFFGPGYSSPMTIIHEVGHYYGAQYHNLQELPLDLAETQSQGNEWLFMAFMESKMTPNFYNATVNYRIFDEIVTIMLCTIIDEFEERVYTHPNIAKLTSDDLDAIMEDVCKNYGGISFLNNIATNVQKYWRMVVVEQPIYYISYSVSAIAAINIFTIAEDDYDQAVSIYCSLIENVELEDGFLGNIKNADLDGPFDEDVYKKLAEMMT